MSESQNIDFQAKGCLFMKFRMYVFSLHTKCTGEFRYFHRISCWQFSTSSSRNASRNPRGSD